MKCGENTNSYAYLIALGVDKNTVDALHGRNFDGFNLQMMPPLDLFGDKYPVVIQDELKPIEPIDISAFVKVQDIRQHPAAQYAIKRGWTETQSNDILIDYFSSAVVFVVRYNDEVVGFQKRFVTPCNPKMKTMSSRNFQKRRFVIEYPNDGDICVVEGPFSALSAWHFGYHAICTFGSNVGELQLDRIGLLAKNTGKKVAIGFDLDSAGRKGYLQIRNTMFWRGVSTYRVKPEQGNDLNDSFLAQKGVITMEGESDSVLDSINLPFKGFE